MSYVCPTLRIRTGHQPSLTVNGSDGDGALNDVVGAGDVADSHAPWVVEARFDRGGDAVLRSVDDFDAAPAPVR